MFRCLKKILTGPKVEGSIDQYQTLDFMSHWLVFQKNSTSAQLTKLRFDQNNQKKIVSSPTQKMKLHENYNILQFSMMKLQFRLMGRQKLNFHRFHLPIRRNLVCFIFSIQIFLCYFEYSAPVKMGQYVPSLNQTQMLGVNTIFLQPNNSLVNTMD